jgi:hypothetical protein
MKEKGRRERPFSLVIRAFAGLIRVCFPASYRHACGLVFGFAFSVANPQPHYDD